jgi:apolipoprotein D and lipocalin family protein
VAFGPALATDTSTHHHHPEEFFVTPSLPRPASRRRARLLAAPIAALALLAGLAAAPSAATAAPTQGSRAAAGDPLPVTPVRALDLQRYSGTWLQLAAVPQAFLAQCVRDTQALYTVLPDGLVKVENSCGRADGSVNRVEGRARVVGPGPAQLEVTFVQVAGQWIFDAAGDYWVIGLGANYDWALVGNPDRSSGFVLSRTPTLSARQIAAVVSAAVRNGYDPCRFQITATTGGIEQNIPLCHATATAR